MELGKHTWDEGVYPLIFVSSFDDLSPTNKTSIPLPQIA
jgi:hypothetical protein